MDSALLLSILFNIGINVEAMTGALAAGERRSMDLIGVLAVASVTAFGGGAARDMLIGRYPLIWVSRILSVCPSLWSLASHFACRR